MRKGTYLYRATVTGEPEASERVRTVRRPEALSQSIQSSVIVSLARLKGHMLSQAEHTADPPNRSTSDTAPIMPAPTYAMYNQLQRSISDSRLGVDRLGCSRTFDVCRERPHVCSASRAIWHVRGTS